MYSPVRDLKDIERYNGSCNIAIRGSYISILQQENKVGFRCYQAQHNKKYNGGWLRLMDNRLTGGEHHNKLQDVKK